MRERVHSSFFISLNVREQLCSTNYSLHFPPHIFWFDAPYSWSPHVSLSFPFPFFLFCRTKITYKTSNLRLKTLAFPHIWRLVSCCPHVSKLCPRKIHGSDQLNIKFNMGEMSNHRVILELAGQLWGQKFREVFCRFQGTWDHWIIWMGTVPRMTCVNIMIKAYSIQAWIQIISFPPQMIRPLHIINFIQSTYKVNHPKISLT